MPSCATMCYMISRSASAAPRPCSDPRVGVRELRQNLSVYLERVISGESLEVTDRGRAVALLVPLRPGATLVDRLVASGRAIPARRQVGDLPPLKGRVPEGLGARAQRALQELGADKI
jgi:prevent-host-death family protein